MKLYPIPPQALQSVFNIVYPIIESSATHSVGKYKGSDIIKFIINGSMQLWAAIEDDKIGGIAITEIVDYPQRKVCRVLCATGENASEWFELIKDLEVWASSLGCKSFEAVTRPGWEKPLKGLGYKKDHIILGKELTNMVYKEPSC